MPLKSINQHKKKTLCWNLKNDQRWTLMFILPSEYISQVIIRFHLAKMWPKAGLMGMYLAWTEPPGVQYGYINYQFKNIRLTLNIERSLDFPAEVHVQFLTVVI